MSSLSITYTPQITSSVINSSPFICHRVCIRLGSLGSYCCYEDNTDSVAGVPKTFDIDLDASPDPCSGLVPAPDPESCTDTVYTGYVQACCESEASLAGRAPFSASFVADPSCINKQVCCVSQRTLIDAYMTISDPGSGYDDGLSPLTVVVVRDAADPVAAGGGNDADVEVTISGGEITAVTVNTGGLYGVSPLIVVPSPTLGSPGITASVVVEVPCADSRYQGDCITSPQTIHDTELLLGQCSNMCFPRDFPFIYEASDLSGLPDTTNFSYAAGGCCDCTTCRNYQVITGSNLPFIDICYTLCDTGGGAELRCAVDTYPGSGIINLNCIVPGSVYSTNDPNGILSVTDTGACGSCP